MLFRSSAQLGEDRIELLLNAPVPPSLMPALNREFADLLDNGAIQAGESCDDKGILRPCLRLRFDKRRVGRLYQLIDHLNDLALPESAALDQPGLRFQEPPLSTDPSLPPPSAP